MSKPKYNKRLIYVSFALAVSLILNIFLCIMLAIKSNKVNENTDNTKSTETIKDEKYPIDKGLIGIWSTGIYSNYAFTENGEVYSFEYNTNLQTSTDIKPERAFITSCVKGHLDENNRFICTGIYRFSAPDDAVYPFDKEIDGQRSMYYYNVFDCPYKKFDKAGEIIYKQSSEVIQVAQKNYLKSQEYDYFLTHEYSPTNVCTWDEKTYTLKVIGEQGDVITEIKECVYNALNNPNIVFLIDEESYNKLKSAPNQDVKVDLSGTELYSGELTDLIDASYENCIDMPMQLMPEHYITFLKRLE